MFPREWHAELAEACKAVGLEYMSTCFLPEDVHVVAPHVARFKIASFEAADRHFLRVHDEWPGIPRVASTGMLAKAQCNELAGWLRRDGVMMHCVSAYSCPDEAASIATVRSLSRAGWLHCGTGYSDHTKNPMAGAVAVAAGAVAVEFHLRHPACSQDNADYEVARTVEEAREYVRLIREVEVLLGEPRGDAPLAAEDAMRPYRVTR